VLVELAAKRDEFLGARLDDLRDAGVDVHTA
jgi:hypothetical protein